MNDNPLATLLVPARRWWWIVASVVGLALALMFVTLPPPPEEGAADASSFSATHLLIRNGEVSTQLTFELVTLLAQQGDLVNRVTERTGLDPLEVQDVQLVSDPVTETLSVTAVRRTPSEAAALASTYGEELIAFLDERTLATIENDYERVTERREEVQASIDDLQDQLGDLGQEDAQRPLLTAELDSLLNEYSELRTQERALAQQREGVTASFVTLEEPVPVPVSGEDDLLALPERPLIRFAIALVIGLAIGLGAVLVYDRFDTRVRTRHQAEEAFGLPVLAELPKRSRGHLAATPLPAFDDPGGVTAEVLRALRLSVQLAPTWHLSSLSRDTGGAVGTKTPVRREREPRTIVITSALTGDGKSTLAANLAISMAEGGKRVLVVDCDFRRPAVGGLLQVEPGTGLRELTHVTERPLEDLAAPTVAPNVAMVRSGSRGVTPSWFMAEAGDLVRRCLEMADAVIFDTGPITLTNEASALLPHVDTGLVVVRSGKVTVDQARGAVEQLTQVDAHVSGIVLVGSEGRRRYGYGYYRSEGDAEEGAVPAATGPVSGERGPWASTAPTDAEVRVAPAATEGDPEAQRRDPT
jgi:capsular exopolysaccharide synthesis family protein